MIQGLGFAHRIAILRQTRRDQLGPFARSQMSSVPRRAIKTPPDEMAVPSKRATRSTVVSTPQELAKVKPASAKTQKMEDAVAIPRSAKGTKRPRQTPTQNKTLDTSAEKLAGALVEMDSTVKIKKALKKRAVATTTAAVLKSPALLDRARKIAEILDELYPNPQVPLQHKTPFQLLCAVALSAQTTDVRVNMVTPELFQLAPDAHAMAEADPERVAEIIRTIGMSKTKSRNLVAMSKVRTARARMMVHDDVRYANLPRPPLLQMLVERHDGGVPSTFDELEALAGVGHKTASVIMSQVHSLPAFAVDTHIHRLAARWHLSSGKNVVTTEEDLKAVFPQDSWNRLHLQIIFFGREHCPAKNHNPSACPMCQWAGNRP